MSPHATNVGSSQAVNLGTDALFDLLSIGTPAQTSSPIIDSSSSSKVSKSHLDSLKSLSSPSVSAKASPPAGSGSMMDLLDVSSPIQLSPLYPSAIAYESSSLKIVFDYSKPPGNPQTTHIKATFTNKTANPYTDFIFQAAVPKFLQLNLDPASSNILPVSGTGSITQSLRVTNSQHGKKALVMRIRIAYKLNNKDMLEEGQINNFPRNL